MYRTFVCIKELNFGIPEEIIRPGKRFKLVSQDKNMYFIQGNKRIYEIYDWSLKEYFKEVV